MTEESEPPDPEDGVDGTGDAGSDASTPSDGDASSPGDEAAATPGEDADGADDSTAEQADDGATAEQANDSTAEQADDGATAEDTPDGAATDGAETPEDEATDGAETRDDADGAPADGESDSVDGTADETGDGEIGADLGDDVYHPPEAPEPESLDDQDDAGGLEPHPEADDDLPDPPDPDESFHEMPGPTETMAATENELSTGPSHGEGAHDADHAPGVDAPSGTPEAAGDGGETPGVHQEVNKVQEVPTPTPPGAEEPEPVPEYTEPPDDEELPLTEHIEEMVKRLGVVMVAAAVVTVLAFPFAENLINVVWYHVHPGTVSNCPGADPCTPPHLYGPLELKLAELKLASLAGIVIALPVFVYESYLFMRPGLYPQERRYYLAAVPTSLVLALVGVAFSYFLVLPALFTYFLYYSQGSVDQIAFALRQTFDLIMMMLGFMAVVFQIPLFIMLAIMMGITTRDWLASRRLYFWGAFAGISFLFSPDPTGMAPIIVAATMVTLFEGTLLILKWVQR